MRLFWGFPAFGLAALVLLAAGPGVAHDAAPAAGSAFDEKTALATSRSAIGRSLGNHRFRDRDGQELRLADLRGRPLVVNMIYTSCYHTCPVTVQTLHRAVTAARAALGDDAFSVVTIGFEAGVDSPGRMRAFAREQGIDEPGWKFVAGDHGTIDRLAKELGFIYFRSPKGFDHLTQTTVIDAEGRVYAQVYGAEFDPPALGEHLKDLIYDRPQGALAVLDTIANKVRLFCTIYDPKSDRYRFDYSVFIGIFIGFVSLAGVGVVLARAIFRHLRRGAQV